MVEFVFLKAREGTEGAMVGAWRAAEEVERPRSWGERYMGERRAGSEKLLGR